MQDWRDNASARGHLKRAIYEAAAHLYVDIIDADIIVPCAHKHPHVRHE